MKISFVVAVAEDGVMGKKGNLPWHIPEDLKLFKQETMGKIMVMGRTTWESLKKKPLPGRVNVVLSRQKNYQAPGAKVFPRVAQREADQIVVALRNKGQKVDYLLAKDEGHGYSRPLNRLAMYAEIEKFLSEILGGARQKSLSPKVAATLQKLRVDIDKVKVK